MCVCWACLDFRLGDRGLPHRVLLAEELQIVICLPTFTHATQVSCGDAPSRVRAMEAASLPALQMLAIPDFPSCDVGAELPCRFHNMEYISRYDDSLRISVVAHSQHLHPSHRWHSCTNLKLFKKRLIISGYKSAAMCTRTDSLPASMQHNKAAIVPGA